MIQLFMKQKVFSWNDRFTVRDASERDVYTVEGEVFTIGKKLHIYDMGGREVAFIHQKVFSLLPQYFVEMDGYRFRVAKDFTFFRQRYYVEELGWTVEGNFTSHEYEIHDASGKLVMSMCKEWFTWGDSYVFYIQNFEDVLPCVTIALVIDCVMAAGAAAASSGK